MAQTKFEPITKEISFEHKCSRCNFTNHTTYNWPVKVYERQGYKFDTFCVECGSPYTYTYIDKIDVEVKVDEDIPEEQKEDELNEKENEEDQ
jgi:hypothetical protein